MFEKIFLVAGHGGGNDPGAVAADGTTERAIAVAVVQRVAARFNPAFVTLVGVHEPLSLTDKIKRVNEVCRLERLTNRSALLVSIHCDYRGASEGVAAYYQAGDDDGAGAANRIAAKLAAATERPLKWIKPDSASRFKRLGIVSDVIPTAVLLEIDSLRADADPDDGLELLKSPAGQDEIVEGIAAGIAEVTGIGERDPIEVAPWAQDSVKKAVSARVATDWSNPTETVAGTVAEHILFKLGVVDHVTGKGVSKERFIVALDRLGALG